MYENQARRLMKEAARANRAAMPVCGTCDVGPIGNEGESFWSPITFWSAGISQLPER